MLPCYTILAFSSTTTCTSSYVLKPIAFARTLLPRHRFFDDTRQLHRITLSGKTSSGKIFVGEKYSSLGKYFVTFSPRKFSPVVFESNHFLTFFNASNIINQSVITTDTFLVLLVIGSSNVSFFIFLINLTFIICI